MQCHFAMCISGNDGDQTADIQPRTVYEILPYADAESVGMVRIVDDSGEDYLYSASFFISIMLPFEAEEIFHSLEVV
ncbi:MAG: hypothetical protein ACOVSW_13335 [Candidatus Kapaibacteriota bacterium]